MALLYNLFNYMSNIFLYKIKNFLAKIDSKKFFLKKLKKTVDKNESLIYT